MPPPTIPITSPSHLSTILSTSRLVIADFHADWCGPCKAIAPIYEALSAQLSRPNIISFVKINVDEQKDIARTYNVSAMPTFMIFKNGRETKRIRGADAKALDQAVRQIAEEAGRADESGEAGSSAAAGGAGASTGGMWAGAAAPRGYADITDTVDMLGLDFLNLDTEAGDKRAVFEKSQPSALVTGKKGKSSEKKDWIESDTDEQLMLFLPFQATLKLHTLQITSSIPEGQEEEVSRPKTIKLYTNRATVLGFDEAEDTPATQEIVIKPTDWDSKTATAKLELRFVKFQNISSLVVFVVDGEGEGEKTRIDRIRLFGETGERRAMGKLEKIGDEQGE